MDGYQFALIIGAGITGLVSLGDRRALAWLATGAADFVATAMYFHYHPTSEFHPFIAAMADAFVCILIDIYGWHRWEMKLWRIFQASVLVNLLRLSGIVPDHTFQAIALEALNWAALVVIGGPRIMRHADGFLAKIAPHSAIALRFHRLVHTVYAKRTRPTFWTASERRW